MNPPPRVIELMKGGADQPGGLMGAVALAEALRLDRGWCLGSEGKFSEGCRELMSRVMWTARSSLPRRRLCTNAFTELIARAQTSRFSPRISRSRDVNRP
jgi:hypothetical protein